MFRVTLRLIAPILLVCAALTALTPRLWQRPVESSPLWTAFGFAACALPCWAGITVGQTPSGAVIERLAAGLPVFSNYMQAGDAVLLLGSQAETMLNGVITYERRGVVRAIEFNLAPALPADALIDRLGAPDCLITSVEVSNGLRTSVVYWESGDFWLSAWVWGGLDGMLSGGGTIYAVTMTATQTADDSPCQQNRAIRWKGIALWWRYEQ